MRSLDLSVTLTGPNIAQCLEDDTTTVRRACESVGGTLQGRNCVDLDITGNLTTGFFNSAGLMQGQTITVGSFSGPLATLTGGSVGVRNTFTANGSASAGNKLYAGGNLIVGGSAQGNMLCTTTDPKLGCNSDCVGSSAFATKACPSNQTLLGISMTGPVVCGPGW
jgi:hypothetical protein